jgi:hypothetical protein
MRHLQQRNIAHLFPYVRLKPPPFRRADLSPFLEASIIRIFGGFKKWIIDMVAIRYSELNIILFG